MRLTELTREHGVKVPPLFGCSVEEISLAVGEVVGHSHVKSAARMNSAVIIFLDTIEAAEIVLMNGISVGEHFLPTYALASPEVKVTVSNVPPFIRNDAIVKELSKHGKVVSPVRRVSSGFQSPLLRHVVSHRRHVLMIPSNRSRVVNLSFKITVDDFDYVIFAKTNDYKCYSCGREGHLSRACPGEHGSNKDQNQRGTEEDRGDEQDGQEGTSGAQEARVGEAVEAQEVRVEEAGVTQEVRVEEAGGVQEVRGEETGATQEARVEVAGGVKEVRVEEAGGVKEVREERTSGGQEVRKDGASEVQQVRESTGGQVEAGGEVDMVAAEEQLKAPKLKRKQEGGRGSSQAKKLATKESGGAAGGEPRLEEDPESGWEDSESSPEDSAVNSEASKHGAGSCRGSGGYSVEEIQEFLKRSKNVRKARVEDYLSDKEKLSSSAKSHMKSKDRGGLTRQEGYRLKKIVHKVDKERDKDGDK